MINDYHSFVKSRCKNGEDILETLTPEKCHLMHMLAGLMDEVGELSSPLKKHIFYNQDLDFENAKEEISDACFYLVGICNQLGFNLEDLLRQNQDKLSKRYPTGYSDQAAKERLDKNGNP